MKNSKYQESEFYARLFDESEEGPFEVLLVHTKAGKYLLFLKYKCYQCVLFIVI